MANHEILEKAIQKAIDGGWKTPWLSTIHVSNLQIDDDCKVYWNFNEYVAAEEIIFNHDFAKALWPDPMIITEDQYEKLSNGKIVKVEDTKEWGLPYQMYRFHLQMMVVADDPIKYLRDNTA
jgi:hypothetical protein